MSNTYQKKPSFLILGAQKAGTTTLFDILNNLEGFSGSKEKEIGFFSKDHFYKQGLDFYLNKFEEDKISFEATPEYLYYDFVPKRIYDIYPNMKFIVLLRNPVERAYSAWNMFKSFNKNNPGQIYDKYTKFANKNIKEKISKLLFSDNYPTFSQSINSELELINFKDNNNIEPSFIKRGLYAEQIANYLKYFSIDNFLFLEQRELDNLQHIVDQVCSFLDLKRLILDERVKKVSNQGQYEYITVSDKKTMKLLQEFFRPYNEKLFSLIGTEYDWNDSQMQSCSKELNSIKKILEKKDQELIQTKKDFDQTKQSLQTKEQELNQTKQSLQTKEQELNQTKQSLQTKEQELNQTKQELENIKIELANLYTSKSWIITRPLRQIMRKLRK